MCQKAPGAMIMLGAAIDDGIVRGHHTPIFDIDERCMPMGAAILAETALRFLRGELGSPKGA
jgi:amidohydrolase